MPVSLRKLLGQDIDRTSRSLIFFVLFCLYLWIVVDLRLIYNCTEVITNFPVFYRGRAFFRGFLSHPGGLVEYTGAFLSQLFYIGWAGALVATIQAGLMSLCFGCILKAVNLSHLRLLRFIPPILLLITYTQYTYHFITTMALLVTLAFVCLYLRITRSLTSNTYRLIVVLILSIFLYTIAAGAYLLFAAVCAMYELLFRRQCMLGLLYLLSAAVIPYVEGVLIFGVSIIDAYSDLSPLSWKILSFDNRRKLIVIIFILYSLLPLTILASENWKIIQNLKIKTALRQIGFCLNPLPAKMKFNINSPVLKWIIESLVLLAIASTAVFFSYDKEKKTVFLTDFYARQRMWPQLLRAARCYPDNYFVVHSVNRALYHTGRLSYDIFFWPQNPHTLFLSTKKYGQASCKKSGIYLDIGLLNMAENALTESLEGLGEHPSILKELALINMAKANYDSARIYLGALSKTLFYDDWANNYLELLKSNPNLSEDREIQRLRSVCMEKDYGFTSLNNIEITLLQLLEKNKQNRMAFEYLMSWYLLNGRLDKFVQNLDRLDDFGFSQFPQLYEEAILINVFSTRKPVNLRGRQISTESRQLFEGFNQILNDYGKNKQAAYNKLAQDYRDSYFFYYVYGRQGTEQ
jgi:hypothetical protein